MNTIPRAVGLSRCPVVQEMAGLRTGQIDSPEVQTRIRMEDSGSTQLGPESTDVRRAFVAFVNARSNGRE